MGLEDDILDFLVLRKIRDAKEPLYITSFDSFERTVARSLIDRGILEVTSGWEIREVGPEEAPETYQHKFRDVSCIVCEGALKVEDYGVGEDTLPNYRDECYVTHPVHDGIQCQSHGNYGSRVLDETDGKFISFFICDPCIVKKRPLVYAFDHVPRRPQYERVPTNSVVSDLPEDPIK